MIVIVSDTISADWENKQEGGKTEEIWKTGQITAPIVWPPIKEDLLLNKLLSSSSSDQNLLFLKHVTSCNNTKFINLNKASFLCHLIFFIFYFNSYWNDALLLKKKLITSYSGFSFLDAEVVMVIPDEFTKKLLCCFYTTLKWIIEG